MQLLENLKLASLILLAERSYHLRIWCNGSWTSVRCCSDLGIDKSNNNDGRKESDERRIIPLGTCTSLVL
jgi:hypothetical protein